MQGALVRLAIFLLAGFSLVASISVWWSMTTKSYVIALLVAMGTGMELAKLALVPAVYKLHKQGSDQVFLVGFLWLITTTVSVTTLVNFLDNNLAFHNSITIAETVTVERNRELLDLKLKAAQEYIDKGYVTKGKQVLKEIETAVTPVTTRATPILNALDNSPVQRYVALGFIAVTIDITTVSLLLLLVSGGSSPTPSPRPVMKRQTATVAQPGSNETVENHILALQHGEPIGVKRIVADFKIRHPQLVELLNNFIEQGEVIKEGTRYIRAGKLRAIK